MSIKRSLPAMLLLAASMFLVNSQQASAFGGKFFDQTGCPCCPVCDHVCKLDVEQVEEERICFKIETKAICIPRVVFPWQKAKKAACASCDACAGKGCTACVHNGARVRKVCVAKPDSYTCPACKYTWSAEKRDNPCGCVGACGGACDGACDGGCAAGPAMMVAPPAEQVAPAPVVDEGDYYRQPEGELPAPAPLPVPAAE